MFLEILQTDIVNLLFWVLWPWLSAGNQFHAFLVMLQRYANLFWLLGTCLVKHNQNDSINL